ncbi:hypothetical protein, partial [Phytopseudomonas daroniae]|uniref:hypothetical protein n=1 Tax=Phytopseudomonas daroniae TaxID=2487519 RepID=UPI001ABFA9D6
MSLYPSTMAVLGWWTKKALSTLRFYLGGWAIVLAGARHCPRQSAASLDQLRRVDVALSIHHGGAGMVDKKSVVHPTVLPRRLDDC